MGDCRWSVESALIDFVEFVEEKPDVWSNVTEEKRPTAYFTLDEACSKYGVDCEVYSQEGGCGFQEHILIKDGEIYENDSVDWEEGTLLDWYSTKEEAEEDLKLTITEEEWENGKLDNVGGYEKWEFEI